MRFERDLMAQLPMRRLTTALSFLCLLAATAPAAVTADYVPPTPYFHSPDAPYTRNPQIYIGFVQPTEDAISEYLMVNDDPTVDQNGRLANATTVPGGLDWTLPGLGPHTVYGQVEYASGYQSAVISLDVVVGPAVASSMYVDLDPGSLQHVANGDWHSLARSTAQTFIAYTMAVDGSAPVGVVAEDDDFRVGFFDSTGAFTPGTHVVSDTQTALVASGSAYCWATGGEYTVNNITLESGPDVSDIDVDFRLLCHSHVMAGSVRYASERAIPAVDPSADSLAFGAVDLGAYDTRTVTFTNIGDVPLDLGAAQIGAAASYSAPGDYTIADDQCSNSSLDVGSSCDLSMEFAPGGLVNRNATLTIPDGTARGDRQFALTGSGQQPTTLDLQASGDTIAPGPITFTMTISPPPGSYDPRFILENGPPSQDLVWTVTNLSGPPRREYSTTVDLAPGTYTASASFEAQGGYLSSSAGPLDVVMTGDSTPPVGQIVVEHVHSGYVNDPSLVIHLPATDNDTGVARVAYETFIGGRGSGWAELAYVGDGPTIDNYLQPGLTEDIHAKWRDVAGNWSDEVVAEVTADVTPPDVAPPAPELVSGTSISSGQVAVDVPLSATDDISGVADVTVNERTDNHAWRPTGTAGAVGVAAATASSALTAGHAYTFRAQATDVATNASGWATGPKLTLKKLQESSKRIRYTGNWKRVRASAFWGGAAKKATSAGAAATLTFTGHGVAWVSRLGPNRGRAQVWVDGVLVDTVDLESASYANKRVVWAQNWETAGKHTVTIKVLGTAGRPRVDLDALLTLG
jgi:hypothetical protein